MKRPPIPKDIFLKMKGKIKPINLTAFKNSNKTKIIAILGMSLVTFSILGGLWWFKKSSHKKINSHNIPFKEFRDISKQVKKPTELKNTEEKKSVKENIGEIFTTAQSSSLECKPKNEFKLPSILSSKTTKNSNSTALIQNVQTDIVMDLMKANNIVDYLNILQDMDYASIEKTKYLLNTLKDLETTKASIIGLQYSNINQRIELFKKATEIKSPPSVVQPKGIQTGFETKFQKPAPHPPLKPPVKKTMETKPEQEEEQPDMEQILSTKLIKPQKAEEELKIPVQGVIGDYVVINGKLYGENSIYDKWIIKQIRPHSLKISPKTNINKNKIIHF